MKPNPIWMTSLFALGFMVAAGGGACAQGNAPDPNQGGVEQPDGASGQKPVPPKKVPEDKNQQTQPGQVSSAPPGVIQPPATGNSNVLPPPSAGPDATPVIKPPGSPGGNPDIQPK